LPCVLNLCEGSDFSAVVDVGCGGGFLVKEISQKSGLVVGVDMAAKNIDLGKQLCSSLANVQLINDTIENFAANHNQSFSLAIANMTLITCVNLSNILEAIKKIITPGGTLVATITHPCFWPDYWAYSDAEWFDYSRQIIIEGPFRISSEVSNCVTTHIHRPLSTYITMLVQNGFSIDRLVEPVPDEKTASRYPTPWMYPRFLGIRCTRT
jgi:SAM-dependent methyltransferase